MTDEKLPENKEVTSELPVVDFESYATICNYENDSSRRRGILSPEMYVDIVNDPNTGFVAINGHRVPALIDIQHGLSMGYDEQRCKRLARGVSDHIRILSIPLDELDENEKLQLTDILGENKIALFFNDVGGKDLGALGGLLDSVGIRHSEKPMQDFRAAKGDKQAGMYLYQCSAIQTMENGEHKKLFLKDVADYYIEHYGPSVTSDGKAETILAMGDQISDQQADAMWEVFNDKFDFLGGNSHPISMQDTREDFLGMLRTGNTLISATYGIGENGERELICFSYFIDNMDNLYWLNQDFLKKKAQSEPRYVTDIYTPGLVSRGIDRNYSMLAIGLFAQVADEAGLSTNVLYENTNLSKRYIPRIVDHTMTRACKHTIVSPSEIIDSETYRLWSIG